MLKCTKIGAMTKLGEAEEHRAIEEMKHAETLIERILFLEGRPIVSELDAIRIGKRGRNAWK